MKAFALTRRRRGDEGEVTALALALGVGFIVLPVLVLVLSVPVWEQRVVDAQDAARAAARALAVAPDWEAGALAADGAVRDLLQPDGVAAWQTTVDLSGSLEPGSTVTAVVTVQVPVGVVPGVGRVGNVAYSAVSRQRVSMYRSSP